MLETVPVGGVVVPEFVGGVVTVVDVFVPGRLSGLSSSSSSSSSVLVR